MDGFVRINYDGLYRSYLKLCGWTAKSAWKDFWHDYRLYQRGAPYAQFDFLQV